MKTYLSLIVACITFFLLSCEDSVMKELPQFKKSPSSQYWDDSINGTNAMTCWYPRFRDMILTTGCYTTTNFCPTVPGDLLEYTRNYVIKWRVGVQCNSYSNYDFPDGAVKYRIYKFQPAQPCSTYTAVTPQLSCHWVNKNFASSILSNNSRFVILLSQSPITATTIHKVPGPYFSSDCQGNMGLIYDDSWEFTTGNLAGRLCRVLSPQQYSVKYRHYYHGL